MTPSPEHRCDVVVAGSGFGGLATSILLARLGLRVVLVEAARELGGVLRSYKRGGVDCPVGVHYFGAGGEQELVGQLLTLLGVRDALGLCRAGGSGIIDRYAFEDFSFDLPSDLETFASNLRTELPRHLPAVEFVVDTLRQSMASMRIDEMGYVARGAFTHMGIGSSAAEILGQQDCPERLRRILSVQGFWTGTRLEDCPASFPFMSIGSLLQSAWRLGCTGAQMADVLAQRARELGVVTIAGDAVDSICVQAGAASGVRLQSGTMIAAGFTVAAMHPKHAVRMTPEGALPSSYREGILALDETPGAFGLVALVDEARHPAIDWNLFNVRGADTSQQRGVFVSLQPSGRPGLNRLLLLSRSGYGEWERWHQTRTGKRGDEYERRKEEVGRRLLSQAQEVLGTIHEPKIVDTWTPLTLRDWVRAPEGGAYGRRHSVHAGLEFQVMLRSRLPRLWFVGQNAMAPGLLGVAMSVLRVIGDVAGRARVREFFVDELHSRKESFV